MNADRMGLMESFVRIVDAGSLSAAAAQQRSTQPTMSRRLQALERSLGVKLLQRSTHAMKLTDDGARCYERAKELLSRWDALESEIRGAGDAPSGTLRVVAPHALGQQHLIAPLAAYLARYPDVAVEWSLHDRTPDFVADGVDCAIHVGAVHDPSLVVAKLGEIPRIVVVAPSVLKRGRRPRGPADLARLPWLALRTFYRTEVTLAHASTGETERFTIQPRLLTDSLYALRAAAVAGVGAALASAWVLGDELARGELVHVAPEWQASPLPIYLVYPPAPFKPARFRRFAEAMREAIPKLEGFELRRKRG